MDKRLHLIAAVLRREDPLGLITPGQNEDEYNAEAALIAARISRCTSREECRRMVWEVFRDAFGEDIAGSEATFEGVADAIWEGTLRQ